jgi:hypothetical protein
VGGGRLGGGRGFGACACPALGRFLGAVTDGEWGWDICGQRTGAPDDEGNERSSPCIYLLTWQSHLACLACHNPAEPMEFASDCDPSFSPRRRGFNVVSWVQWALGGGGGLSPPGLSLLIDGPVDPGKAPVAAKLAGCVLGSCPGTWGAWVLGRGSLRGVLSPPSCCGLTWSLCFTAWGDLPNLSYSNSARGCGGTVRRLSIKEIVTWDPSLACPLGLRQKIQARVSDDIPAACIKELRVFSLLLRTCGDLRGL